MSNNTALQIKATFILDTNVPTLSIQDNTNYSALTGTVNSIKGIFTVNLENGYLVYQNNDYENPDISASGQTKTGITLPTSLNQVRQGAYRIQYKLLVNGTEYVNSFSYNFVYQKVSADLVLTIDGYSSTVNSQDNTNYSGAGTIQSLTRTHTVTPPTASPLSVTTNNTDSISYSPNIWSGTWTSTISTSLVYLINGLYIQDTVYSEVSDIAYKADMNVVRGWVMDYKSYYVSLLGNNIALAEKINANITQVNTYMDLYDKALTNADIYTAYLCIYNVIKIVSPDLSITSEEIQPFVLVVTIPTDDKWLRNGTTIYPKNQETVAIGRTSPIGTEKLSINGTALLSELWVGSNNTMRIYQQGADLVFTDGTITKKLSELGGNVDLSNYIRNDNSTWVSLVSKMHDPVTLATGESVLQLTGQVLSTLQATSTNPGFISASDYQSFINKQSHSDVLDKLSDIGIGSGIIVGTGTSLIWLSNPTSDKVLGYNSTASSIMWVDSSGGSETFTVPDGKTRISNEIGGLNNTIYSDITQLNGKTLVSMWQEALFPSPKIPDWIAPTATLTNSLTTYVECGTTQTVTLTPHFTSTNNYAVVTGTTTYTLNSNSFTNGTSVSFSTLGNYLFQASISYIANSGITITLSDGNTITPDQLNGYPTSNRILTPTNTLVSVDPIYIGCVSGISAWSSIDWATIKSQLTTSSEKLITSEPTSEQTLNVETYNTNVVDYTKWIVVIYPASYGDLTSVTYVEASYSDVLKAGTFTKISGTFTRTSGTTVPYYVYYAPNKYCTGGTVTYKVKW